jgi:hypothetical protein
MMSDSASIDDSAGEQHRYQTCDMGLNEGRVIGLGPEQESGLIGVDELERTRTNQDVMNQTSIDRRCDAEPLEYQPVSREGFVIGSHIVFGKPFETFRS